MSVFYNFSWLYLCPFHHITDNCLFSCTLGFILYHCFNCKNTLLEIKFQAAWVQLSPEFYSNILLHMPTDSQACIYNLLINHTHRRHTTLRCSLKKYSDLLLKEKIFRLEVQLSLKSKTGRFTHTCWIQQIISIRTEQWWRFYCQQISVLVSNLCCGPTFIWHNNTYLKHFKS